MYKIMGFVGGGGNPVMDFLPSMGQAGGGRGISVVTLLVVLSVWVSCGPYLTFLTVCSIVHFKATSS